jgi:sulfur-oxidizing protein SoxY
VLSRRTLLESGGALLALLGVPKVLRAGTWPRKAFEATAANEALVELYGSDRTRPSNDVDLTAPLIAENGAVVPITVETSLEDVRSISIVVENNPRPLAVAFEIPAGTRPALSFRIKMAETSKVMAVVQTGSGLFSAARDVKVTVGGCA